MAYNRKALLVEVMEALLNKCRSRDRYMDRADRLHDRWAAVYNINPEQAEGYWQAYAYAQDKAIDLQVEIATLTDRGKTLAGFKRID